MTVDIEDLTTKVSKDVDHFQNRYHLSQKEVTDILLTVGLDSFLKDFCVTFQSGNSVEMVQYRNINAIYVLSKRIKFEEKIISPFENQLLENNLRIIESQFDELNQLALESLEIPWINTAQVCHVFPHTQFLNEY